MGRSFFRPAHRDAAEPAIINALRAVGASVWPISGKDVPDLLVGYRGVTYLLEVKSRLTNTRKDGHTRKSTTKVSEGQKAFMDSWKGGPARVVHTPEEALYAIGAPIEGVLEPLPSASWCRCAHYANAHAKSTGHCMIHGCDCLGVEVETLLRHLGPGHVVTPAYQKAQTDAVAPKKRRAK